MHPHGNIYNRNMDKIKKIKKKIVQVISGHPLIEHLLVHVAEHVPRSQRPRALLFYITNVGKYIPNFILNIASWAEDNPIVGPCRASKQACRIILRIAVSIRAPVLEKLGEIRRSTVARIAAVLIRLKSRTRSITPSRNLQLFRTLSHDIRRAFDHTVALARSCAELHRNVKSFYVGDIDEILVLILV